MPGAPVYHRAAGAFYMSDISTMGRIFGGNCKKFTYSVLGWDAFALEVHECNVVKISRCKCKMIPNYMEQCSAMRELPHDQGNWKQLCLLARLSAGLIYPLPF